MSTDLRPPSTAVSHRVRGLPPGPVPRLRRGVRWAVGGLVVVHGLLHLLGAAQGLGWARVAALTQPVNAPMGAVWLMAAALVILAGVMLARSLRWWWAASAVAAVVSQAVICTSWVDARAGTLVNVVLLIAAVYGYLSQGSRGLRRDYRDRVSTALAEPLHESAVTARSVTDHDGTHDVVTEQDLTPLPTLVAAYLRRTGAVGQPRLRSFRAVIHGRIRGRETQPWMTFTGEQVNTYGPDSSRLFFMDASMRGVPVDVLHVFVGDAATMRVTVASAVPMVDAAGPQMERGETVTVFNDLCVLAPAALVDADVQWREVDPHRVRGTFTRRSQSVTADLIFDQSGDLVDFVSDDRLAASADGKTFTARRWSTPLARYRTVGGRRLAVDGEARWEGGGLDHAFTYIEFHIDEITYNVSL